MNGATMHKDGSDSLQTDLRHFDLRRLIALVTKESYQALRDPSTLLIALDTPDALKRAAANVEHPDPTMEDAFIHLVESADREMEAAA